MALVIIEALRFRKIHIELDCPNCKRERLIIRRHRFKRIHCPQCHSYITKGEIKKALNPYQREFL
jgi:transposase-like protein